ncbi:trans-sialidase, putative, partial [Trypanosoma cruzi]
MHSRVAACEGTPPHTPSPRDRIQRKEGEGGESEPQRPNMSRRVFTSAVLPLCFLRMGCGPCDA